MSDPIRIELPLSIDGYAYLFDNEPFRGDISAILDKAKEVAGASADQRNAGDQLAKNPATTSEAKVRFELALRLNERAIGYVKQYKDFDQLFQDDGTPRPGASQSQYPLEGGEKKLAKLLDDLLGRSGGLLRRLDRKEEAYASYAIGAEIERNGSSFGVVNSYCTLNAIAIQIELGRKRASRSPNPPPDLSAEIKAARKMVKDQFKNGRKRDLWAMADLGMACVLGGDISDNRDEAQEQYYEYARSADADDFDTTRRVLSLVETQLRHLDDPVANTVKWIIDFLDGERQDQLKSMSLTRRNGLPSNTP
jgi:hypothetical protein